MPKSRLPFLFNHTTTRTLLGCGLSLLLILAGTAHAEDKHALGVPGLDLSIGAGVTVMPAFPGAEGQKISPAPYINGGYRDLIDFDFLDGIRLNALHVGNFTAGPAARYRYGRSTSDAADALRGMGNIDDSLELGGFVGFDHGPYSAEFLVLQDVTGANSGLLAEGRASIGIPIGKGGIEIGPFVSFADRTYMQTYYGISTAQAASSGRSPFSPSAGFDMIGMEIDAMYPIDERFSIRGYIDYDRLVGDAAHAPFIEQGGAQDQITVGVFLVYSP